MKNIIVFNQARMGDLLESSPLLNKIRRVHPNSRITLVVLPEFVTIAKWLPEADEVLPFDDGGILAALLSAPDWIDSYGRLSAFVEEWRKKGFDLAYNLVYSKAGALFLSAIGVNDVFGLKVETGSFCSIRDPWSAYLWNFCRFIDYNPFNITDMFRLCGEIDPGPAGYDIRPEVRQDPNGLHWLQKHGLNETRFVAIQPGSNSPDRRVDPVLYARAGDAMAAHGSKVVVLGSPKELPLVSEVLSAMASPGVEGICSLTELCGILSQSALLLTNDTGTMHLAAALEVPILLVCSGISNPAISGPYREGAIALVPKMECQPCRPSQVCSTMHCRSAISAETISQTALWVANGQEEVLRPGPFPDALIRKVVRDSLGFLRARGLDAAPLSSIESARELWANFWLHFAGYKRDIMNAPIEPLAYSAAAEVEMTQLRQDLENWGRGLSESAGRLSAVLGAGTLELLNETKGVLSCLEQLTKAGKSPHLLPFRVMLNHMQEHLFDPDPKRSVEMLAGLLRDYGEGMQWVAGQGVCP